MTMPMIDEFLYDTTRPSLRIAPLQNPFPAPSNGSSRPSPLEPCAHVNVDDKTNKLTGRRKALARAKALDAPDLEERDLMTNLRLETGTAALDGESLREESQKQQRLGSYDHGQLGDFVQLPKPAAKATNDKPRPFRPVSILNKLHEPPPSAALFPPITSDADQDDEGGTFPSRQSSIVKHDKGQGSGKKGKPKRNSVSPKPASRTYKRGRTKWSLEEIECLITGVTIYGTGRWKNILEHPDLHFHQGRTPTDLKDRFRVCFPPNAKGQPHKAMPTKIETSKGEMDTSLPILTKDQSRKTERPLQRARKRHWTEVEDAELEKGFRQYGYNWKAMVKDPELHFDGRTGGQIRDRFRLKFKNLYEGQDVKCLPTKTTTKGEFQQHDPPEQANPPVEKPSSVNAQAEGEDGSNGIHSKTTTKSSLPCGLLNGEDEDSRLSNSILHDDSEWDENLTLAPLTWEDMATRPLFSFD